jgi:hypothetical protein
METIFLKYIYIYIYIYKDIILKNHGMLHTLMNFLRNLNLRPSKGFVKRLIN